MLLEREGLLSTLGAALDAAANGSGRVLLVAGEAGAGKTSLVNAFTESLGDSTLVIRGSCDPLSTPRPLSPLYDFAADEHSGLSDLPLGEGENLEVFRHVLERLQNTIRPIVMIMEDLHWADEGTLDFLRFLGRRIGDTKTLMLCTYRDDETGPEHPLRPVLGQLIPLDTTSRVMVPPLSVEAISQLSTGTDFEPDAIYAITGGNAFFVTEIIASGSTLPETVHDAVLARVAGLERGPREVVEAVSIAPRDLEIDRALLLVRGEVDHVDRAVSSGVIQGDGHNLRFRHELARSAVEGSVPPARRHVLHSRMLALLLEEDPLDHARVAHHAVQARSPELIVDHAPRAARAAIERGARREGVEFYRAALRHSDLLEPEEEAGLRLELGQELRHLDRPEEALPEVDAAVAHFRESGDDRLLAEGLMQRHALMWMLSRIEEGWVDGREAISILRPLGPSHDLGMALYRSAHSHMLARHAKPALEDVEESIAIGKKVGSDEVVWLGQMVRGTIEIVVGNGAEGVRMLQESHDEAVRMGSRRFQTIALGMLGSGGGECRLYEPALAALDAGIAIGMANDEDYNVSYDLAWRARIAFEQGRWDDATADADRAMKISSRPEGISYLTAMGAVGRVRVRRGDPGAQELLSEVIESGSANELQHIWSPVSGLAEFHWMRDEPDEMVAVLSGPYQRALETDSEWARGELGFWMWRAGAIERAPDNCAEPYRLQIDGHWQGAVEHWQVIGCPYEVGLALADGDDQAKLDALEIFDRLGGKPMGDRIRAELRARGVESIPRGPSRSTLDNLAGLTNRQLEVLTLMKEGLTNSEIAEELFISKKTVEHHVSAIFSKLGVSTRAKAVASLDV